MKFPSQGKDKDCWVRGQNREPGELDGVIRQKKGVGGGPGRQSPAEQEPEVNDPWESMGEGVSFCPQFRTCCLETQLKTFISTVILNYSLSKPCSVSLDVIKGSYPIGGRG